MKVTCVWLVLTVTSVLSLVTSGLAADDPLSTRDLDSRIDRAIFQTITIGAPLYNQGDPAGCYRLYQGTLIVIETMLGHRADLQAEVAKGLKDVQSVPTYAQRATDLRRILDRILATVRSAPTPSAPRVPRVPRVPRSLWTRLGGEPAIKAAIHEFAILAVGDPQVDFTRGGKYPLDEAGLARLEGLFVDLISAVAGGPRKYRGRDMKSVHAGMAISDDQFDALMGDLRVVLTKRNAPAKEADELLAVVAATRKDIVEGRSTLTFAPPPPPDPLAAKPLWDRLGGEAGVKTVVHDFVTLAVGDPEVDFMRGGKYPLDEAGLARLEGLFVELISAVAGGPRKYQGRDMKSVHAGMVISDDQFDALEGDLRVVLRKHEVPRKEADELLAIVAATRKDVVKKGVVKLP